MTGDGGAACAFWRSTALPAGGALEEELRQLFPGTAATWVERVPRRTVLDEKAPDERTDGPCAAVASAGLARARWACVKVQRQHASQLRLVRHRQLKGRRA